MKTSIQSHFRLILFVVLAASVSLALGDDFKTTAGKEYKDATVTRVEPDGIIVKMKGGISKLYFGELPREVQERFHYNPQTATAYTAAQAAVYEADAKQQEEVRDRQDDANAQKNAMIAKQQAANDRAQSLQDRELVREQDMALRKAKQHEEAAHTRRQKYPTLYQVPVVHSELSTANHQAKQRKQPKQPKHE